MAGIELKMTMMKKKKKRKEKGEIEREEASLFSSPAGNAAAKQLRKQKPGKLCSQDQEASTGEEIICEGKMKTKNNGSKSKVQLCEEGNLQRGKDKEEEEKQRERKDAHLEEENLHTQIKKKQEKKRRKHNSREEDQHSKGGMLLEENNQEDLRKRKRKRKGEGERPNASLPHAQQESTPSLCGDYAAVKKKGKEKEDRNWLYSYAKETFFKHNASFDVKNKSKKARSLHVSTHYNLEPDGAHELLSNKEAVGDHIEQQLTSIAINGTSDMDLPQKKNIAHKKRTTFHDQIFETRRKRIGIALNKELSPLSGNSNEQVEEIWGVRFTPEEEEILKNAIWKCIERKGWGKEEGLSKMLNLKKHREARSCWADIKMCLPHRPLLSIRQHARLLLEKAPHSGKWSKEDIELLKRLQKKYGNKWKKISVLLDKHHINIKEKWRYYRRPKPRGVWTQGEIQQLSDTVHRCLRIRALLGMRKDKPDHHILRDRINWDKIADQIGTHCHGSCCNKWYHNLQSSLVTDGHWASEDDCLLLKSLLESGACAEEEVDWDKLLNHRSGHICLIRWKQMVKYLGENRTRQFLDKLDILVRRYAPELLEASRKDIDIAEVSSIED